MRVTADLQERVSERIVEQTVDNTKQAVDAPIPQPMEGIVEVGVASAPTVTWRHPDSTSASNRIRGSSTCRLLSGISSCERKRGARTFRHRHGTPHLLALVQRLLQ